MLNQNQFGALLKELVIDYAQQLNSSKQTAYYTIEELSSSQQFPINGKLDSHKINHSSIPYWCNGAIPKDKESLIILCHIFFTANVLVKSKARLLMELANFSTDEIESNLIAIFPEEPTSSFVIGVPITNPKQFIGRKNELINIEKKLNSSPIQNSAIVGPSKSGKSSLLIWLNSRSHVEHLLTSNPHPLYQKFIDQTKQFQFAYIDFSNTEMHQVDLLLNTILRQLNLPTINISGPFVQHHFNKIIKEKLTQKSIILFDNIEKSYDKMMLHGEKDPDFWFNFRSLISDPSGISFKLGFILSAPNIEVLFATDQYGRPSPLINIVAYILELAPFSKEEARTLLKSSPSHFPAEDIEWIIKHSHCWPAILQQFSQIRLDNLNNPSFDWKAHCLKLGPIQYPKLHAPFQE